MDFVRKFSFLWRQLVTASKTNVFYCCFFFFPWTIYCVIGKLKQCRAVIWLTFWLPNSINTDFKQWMTDKHKTLNSIPYYGRRNGFYDRTGETKSGCGHLENLTWKTTNSLVASKPFIWYGNKMNLHVYSNTNWSRFHQIKSNNIASYKLTM